MKKITPILFFLFLTLASYGQVCQVFITHMISGNQVQYNASSPDNPATWSWFFNGGTPLTSSIQNPVVTYAIPGTYICACTVSGGPNNCSPSLSAGQDTVTILNTGLQEVKRINDVFIFNRNSIPTFELNSSTSQYVSVELFDLSSRLVDRIFEGFLTSGSNIFQMRPIGLPDGNYVLRIVTDDSRLTKKFNWNN